MQQHPIPQNVIQYEFRLVGDMTLKQFLELCIGLGLAYLFFASNLIFLIKWPLIIISILFGAALAFFPIEDRPLDQWITNFLRAIYAPTRFIWEKTNKIPPLFLFEAHAPKVVNTVTKTIKAPSSISAIQQTTDLSDIETTKISSLDSIFKTLSPPPPITKAHLPVENIEKPTISIRKLSTPENVAGVTLHSQVTNSPLVPNLTTITKTDSPPANNTVFAAPSAPRLNVVAPAATAKHITLPASPKLPNLITGVVVDSNKKLIENAIVQIVSSDGIPARAMKTNSLGQFYTSTPLGNGVYVIEIDKQGLNFPPQKITVNDTILPPIELRASS